LGADIGWTFKLLLVNLHPIPLAAAVLGGYGIAYFGVTFALGMTEASTMIEKVLRLLKVVK
jgi:hypothetical protein